MGEKTDIGILLNTSKEKVIKNIKDVLFYLRKENLNPLLLKEEAEKCNIEKIGIEKDKFLSRISLLLTFGGDGTLLRGTHLVAGKDIPLLGINVGNLGFLTEISLNEFPSFIPEIKRRNFILDKRKGLITKINGDEIFSLNDTVIVRKNSYRMIELSVYIDNKYLSSFSADGLIISTSTGSTAHSLSAGGPILHPEVNGIIIIPICPHTLSHRPIIIPSSFSIKINCLSPGGVSVICDGQERRDISPGTSVNIKGSLFSISLLRFKKSNFYSILREKLRF